MVPLKTLSTFLVSAVFLTDVASCAPTGFAIGQRTTACAGDYAVNAVSVPNLWNHAAQEPPAYQSRRRAAGTLAEARETFLRRLVDIIEHRVEPSLYKGPLPERRRRAKSDVRMSRVLEAFIEADRIYPGFKISSDDVGFLDKYHKRLVVSSIRGLGQMTFLETVLASVYHENAIDVPNGYASKYYGLPAWLGDRLAEDDALKTSILSLPYLDILAKVRQDILTAMKKWIRRLRADGRSVPPFPEISENSNRQEIVKSPDGFSSLIERSLKQAARTQVYISRNYKGTVQINRNENAIFLKVDHEFLYISNSLPQSCAIKTNQFIGLMMIPHVGVTMIVHPDAEKTVKTLTAAAVISARNFSRALHGNAVLVFSDRVIYPNGPVKPVIPRNRPNALKEEKPIQPIVRQEIVKSHIPALFNSLLQEGRKRMLSVKPLESGITIRQGQGRTLERISMDWTATDVSIKRSGLDDTEIPFSRLAGFVIDREKFIHAVYSGSRNGIKSDSFLLSEDEGYRLMLQGATWIGPTGFRNGAGAFRQDIARHVLLYSA